MAKIDGIYRQHGKYMHVGRDLNPWFPVWFIITETPFPCDGLPREVGTLDYHFDDGDPRSGSGYRLNMVFDNHGDLRSVETIG